MRKKLTALGNQTEEAFRSVDETVRRGVDGLMWFFAIVAIVVFIGIVIYQQILHRDAVALAENYADRGTGNLFAVGEQVVNQTAAYISNLEQRLQKLENKIDTDVIDCVKDIRIIATLTAMFVLIIFVPLVASFIASLCK